MDFVPICGDSYIPKSLKFRLRVNAEILYSGTIGPGSSGYKH
jgi:hypothetical protein